MRKEFFQEHAHEWDEICTYDEEKIGLILDLLGLHGGDQVLDVGTGTGILIPYIIERIFSTGKIIAVDYSENMILRAKNKYPSAQYANVDFIVEDFFALNNNNEFDAIICYSCFPHIDDKQSFFEKSYNMLKKKGKVLIAHSESRDDINEMHGKLHPAVCNDYLPPAEDIVRFASRCDFILQEKLDDDKLFCLLFEK